MNFPLSGELSLPPLRERTRICTIHFWLMEEMNREEGIPKDMAGRPGSSVHTMRQQLLMHANTQLVRRSL